MSNTTSFDLEAEVSLRISALWGHHAIKVDPKWFEVNIEEPVYGSNGQAIPQPEENISSCSADNPLSQSIEMDLKAEGDFQAMAENRLSQSVTAGGLSIPIPFPVIGDVNFGVTPTNETTNTTRQQTRATQKFSQTFKLQVDPKTHVSAALKVTPVKYVRPFTATVSIKGTIKEAGLLGTSIGSRSIGLGTLFIDYSSPAVHVESPDTIRVQVSGESDATIGTNCSLVPSATALGARNG